VYCKSKRPSSVCNIKYNCFCFSDKFDLISLLQLCKDYKTDWIKETIESLLLCRISIFYDDDEFTNNTFTYRDGLYNNKGTLYHKYFKYRKSKQNREDNDDEDADDDGDNSVKSNDDSMRRSYDDTLVLYFLYLAEKFNLEQVISSCKCYPFEAELCDLKDFNGCNILQIFSTESTNHINKYYLKRALVSYKANKYFDRDQGNILDLALDTALDEICEAKPECSCGTKRKRKK